jgi:hypothetical protein
MKKFEERANKVEEKLQELLGDKHYKDVEIYGDQDGVTYVVPGDDYNVLITAVEDCYYLETFNLDTEQHANSKTRKSLPPVIRYLKKYVYIREEA